MRLFRQKEQEPGAAISTENTRIGKIRHRVDVIDEKIEGVSRQYELGDLSHDEYHRHIDDYDQLRSLLAVKQDKCLKRVDRLSSKLAMVLVV